VRKLGVLLVALVLISGLSVPAGATAKLNAELLSLGQLGKGWLAASGSTSSVPGCDATALPTGSTAQASVTFNFGQLKAFPLLIETLGTYKDVDNAFGALTAALKACTHAIGTKKGQTFTSTVAESAFTSYGDQSAYYYASIRGTGLSVAEDILVVRKGNVLMQLEEGNNNASVNVTAFRSFAAAATHKL